MKCRICQANCNKIFQGKVLNKYNISYYHCPNCDFLQTEDPYWLNESYQESINISDTGILQRNIQNAKLTSIILYFFFNKKGRFLDYGGGYALLTRLMRDIGFDFYWNDLYSNNIFAKGFEYHSKLDNIELITAFECFEHFNNPLKDIEIMLDISKNILFSTLLLPGYIPKPEEWWYYGLNHGQHISFYSIKTISFIAKNYHLNYYSNGMDIHLFTPNKINNIIYYIALKYKWLIYHIIKNKMNSLTNADSNQLSRL